MNVKCKNRFEGCEHDSSEGCTYSGKCIEQVHNTEPDEAAESARTSGSPTASRSDSVIEGTVQLAPVLRPDSGAANGHDWDAHRSLENCNAWWGCKICRIFTRHRAK